MLFYTIANMDFIGKIENILREPLQALGYEIVRIQFRGSQRKTLELMIERQDGEPIRVEDCVHASHEASAHLDIADPIESSYVLEVSSPGLDRPLVRKHDFERFAQKTVKINTHVPIEGSRRFQGLLLGLEGEDIVLNLQEEPVTLQIPFESIRDARLVPPLNSGNTSQKKKR
jgi:ribosome maturation factor RimP